MLRVQIEAGIGILGSLHACQTDSLSPRLQKAFQTLISEIEQGGGLHDAASKCPLLFNEVDLAILKFSEETGNIPLGLRQIEEINTWLATIRRKTINAMIYPLAILNGAYLALNIPTLIFGSPVDYVIGWVKLNLIIALGLFGLFHARRIAAVKQGMDHLIMITPGIRDILGRVILHYSNCLYFKLMSVSLQSGNPPIHSLRMAGHSVGNVEIQRDMIAAADRLQNGCSISEALAPALYINEVQKAMLDTGESAGSIPKVAAALSRESQDNLDLWLTLYYKLLPLVLFLLVAAMLIPTILSQATQIFTH